MLFRSGFFSTSNDIELPSTAGDAFDVDGAAKYRLALTYAPGGWELFLLPEPKLGRDISIQLISSRLSGFNLQSICKAFVTVPCLCLDFNST